MHAMITASYSSQLSVGCMLKVHLVPWSQQGQGTLVVVGRNAALDATTLLKADANYRVI